jgi:deazaflavin-dependent oxidoreductase (nitroreductase family)
MSLLHSLVQKMASSRPGAWTLSRILHHFDRIFLKLTGGRATLTSLLAGVPVVMLTTTGARSGLARTVPVLSIRDEGDANAFAIIASNWGQRRHPAWYFNLKANPRARCLIDGKVRDCLAREAEGGEYERFWQLGRNLYPGFSLYEQRAGDRRIPIIVMRWVDLKECSHAL